MSQYARLAAYLDQRLRIGEPDIFTERPGLLRRARAAVTKASSGQRERPLTRTAPGSVSAEVFSGRNTRDPTLPGPVLAPAPVTFSENAGYSELRANAVSCTRCRLSGSRTQVVFSDGNPKGRLMVVGEAPGAREDATGLPFVGPAGKLLDLVLASVGLSRKESVYICNVLKCRPPGNRNPLQDEIDACAPFLKRQIELVRPEVILAAGSFAAQWLTASRKSLGKLRGKVYSYHGVPLVVTYHPAALAAETLAGTGRPGTTCSSSAGFWTEHEQDG